MRRLVWMAVGAGITIYVMRRSKAGLAALLPPGFARALGAPNRPASADTLLDELATGAGEFVTDFRAAQKAREAELRAGMLNQSDPHDSGPSTPRRRGAVPNYDWEAYDPDIPGSPEDAEEPIFEF